jgi:hypothetical protein
LGVLFGRLGLFEENEIGHDGLGSRPVQGGEQTGEGLTRPRPPHFESVPSERLQGLLIDQNQGRLFRSGQSGGEGVLQQIVPGPIERPEDTGEPEQSDQADAGQRSRPTGEPGKKGGSGCHGPRSTLRARQVAEESGKGQRNALTSPLLGLRPGPIGHRLARDTLSLARRHRFNRPEENELSGRGNPGSATRRLTPECELLQGIGATSGRRQTIRHGVTS